MTRNILAICVAVLLGALAFWAWILTTPATIAANSLPPHSANLANGETMFNAGGCAACHVPKATGEPRPDRTRLVGGRPIVTPVGTFYSPNISPDRTDGIGAWSETDFVNAMWKGTSPDGRHYFPAFPYTSYQRMKLEDVRDLFAYLKTLPAVPGRARDHDLRFPFNLRRPLGAWKLLFLDGAPYRPDPAQTAQWNRGAYLANGPSHCGECHSPRSLFGLGAIKESERFAGAPDPSGEGFVPNITQKRLSAWSVKDFEILLDSGQTPDFDSVGGEMAEVVRNVSRLSADDRTAMATYLKSLKPIDGTPPPAKK